MEKPITSKEYILQELSNSLLPMAIHEFSTHKFSQNNLATRMSELAKAGLIEGRVRRGKCYKEWYLVRK